MAFHKRPPYVVRRRHYASERRSRALKKLQQLRADDNKDRAEDFDMLPKDHAEKNKARKLFTGRELALLRRLSELQPPYRDERKNALAGSHVPLEVFLCEGEQEDGSPGWWVGYYFANIFTHGRPHRRILAKAATPRRALYKARKEVLHYRRLRRNAKSSRRMDVDPRAEAPPIQFVRYVEPEGQE
jgi:hypothetical protein